MVGVRGGAIWAGRTLLWSMVVLVAQSVLWADVHWPLKALVVAVAGLSAWRPQHGLLAAAGLVPFGNLLVAHVFESYFGLSEALVLAFLAGALAPWRRYTRQYPADGVRFAGLTLAIVFVASIAVQFTIERGYQDHWPSFIAGSLRYLAIDYLTAQPDIRPWVVGLGFLPPALLWIEGIAMFLVTRALCRAIPELWRRLLAVAVVAATGTAVFSWAQLLSFARQSGMNPIAALQESSDRWTGAFPSINSTGSYFAMMALMALGLAWQARRVRRALWIAAAAVIAPAAMMTKSRAAIVALTSMGGAMATRRIIRGWRAAVVVAAVAVLGLVIAIQFVNPLDLIRSDTTESIRARGPLVQGAARMIAANPAFGVGVGQFRLRFPDYAPVEAKNITYAVHPHNHLLGVATELGLVGLAAFVWFVGGGLWQGARVLRARPLDGAAIGVFCGIVALLITGLSDQPLNFPVPAYTFWMLFGACQAASPEPRAAASRPAAWLRYATAAAIIGLVISVPFRARAAIEGIDFTPIQYGFHDWDRDGQGTKFRWSSDHSTMFMSKEMSQINLPIGASLGGTPKGVEVRIFVDGHRAGQLFLTDEAWHDVRLVAPRTGKTWRIDLYVSPTFVPMEINPAILDARRLGVRVGEPVQREIMR
jgi:O-antigen ligase